LQEREELGTVPVDHVLEHRPDIMFASGALVGEGDRIRQAGLGGRQRTAQIAGPGARGDGFPRGEGSPMRQPGPSTFAFLCRLFSTLLQAGLAQAPSYVSSVELLRVQLVTLGPMPGRQVVSHVILRRRFFRRQRRS